jgi:polysaccharide biosynthesis transport protein
VQSSPPYPVQNRLATPPADLKSTWSADFVHEVEFDLGEYWGIVRRHWRLTLSLFIAVEFVTAIALLTKTPLYTGLSTILIEQQTPEVLEHNSDRSDQDYDAGSFYKTQYEILKSRTLAAVVINNLALEKNPDFMGPETQPSLLARCLSSIRSFLSKGSGGKTDADNGSDILGVNAGTIDKYLADLTIRPELDTRLVEVAFTSPVPELTAKITNAHVQAYIQEGYDLRSRSSQAAQKFLESQLTDLEKRLEKSEAALNDYRRERGIVAFSLNDKDRLVSDRMTGLNRVLVDAEERRISLQADVETINSNNYDAVPGVVSNTLIQGLKVELSRLQGQYANLSSQFTPNYPDVAQLHAQIAQVQRREQQEISRVVESIKSNYASALEKENQLTKELEDEKAHAMSLNDASLRDAVLTREVSTNRALYSSVLERIKELGVASGAQVTNVSIIDTAAVPLGPSSPKTRLSLVLAGFLALMLGAGVAFVMESADKGLKTADDVQRYLHLPNLATVICFSGANIMALPAKKLPLLPILNGNANGRETGAARQSARAPGIAENSAVDGGANTAVPGARVFGAPTDARLFGIATEAYRAIRTSILLSRAETPPKMVLFTSAIAGEGKTVTAVNTAVAFAGMQNRVLLIDADLRRGRCHEIMDVEPHPGLSEVLSGLHELESAIQPTAVNGLFLLSAGLNSPNPTELLGSQKMRDVLAAVSSLFEHVVIDSAPVLPVSDSVVLSTTVDAVVLVAGSDTAKQLVRDSCSRLFYVGAKIVGIVLNKVQPEQQRYYSSRYLYKQVG